MITQLKRPLANVSVAMVLMYTPCVLALVFNRLLLASLCLRDPYPLAQYFFSINFGSLIFLGLLFMVSIFSAALAWPSQPQSGFVVIKFLGMYMVITFAVLVIALYLTDSYIGIGDPAINLRCIG